jgi:excisionase family DNA binding protein
MASAATGIPLRTIQRWARDGWLTDYGSGRNVRVDLDDVMELAEERPNGRLRNGRTVA